MYCLIKEIIVKWLFFWVEIKWLIKFFFFFLSNKWLIKLIEVNSHDLKEYPIGEVPRLAWKERGK